jgi:hypothetical protein
MLLSSTYAGVQVDIVRGERRHGSPARRMVLVRICVRCRPPHDYCTGVAGCWAQPPRHRRGFPWGAPLAGGRPDGAFSHDTPDEKRRPMTGGCAQSQYGGRRLAAAQPS